MLAQTSWTPFNDMSSENSIVHHAGCFLSNEWISRMCLHASLDVANPLPPSPLPGLLSPLKSLTMRIAPPFMSAMSYTLSLSPPFLGCKVIDFHQLFQAPFILDKPFNNILFCHSLPPCLNASAPIIARNQSLWADFLFPRFSLYFRLNIQNKISKLRSTYERGTYGIYLSGPR